MKELIIIITRKNKIKLVMLEYIFEDEIKLKFNMRKEREEIH